LRYDRCEFYTNHYSEFMNRICCPLPPVSMLFLVGHVQELVMRSVRFLWMSFISNLFRAENDYCSGLIHSIAGAVTLLLHETLLLLYCPCCRVMLGFPCPVSWAKNVKSNGFNYRVLEVKDGVTTWTNVQYNIREISSQITERPSIISGSPHALFSVYSSGQHFLRGLLSCGLRQYR
jgi:hypothetical protein